MTACMGRRWVLAALALCLSVPGLPVPPAAIASDKPLLSACWAPEALAGKADEKLSRKHDRSFDAPPVEGWLVNPVEPAPAGALGAIRSVRLPPGKKLIALTFDLCEQPGEIAGYDGAIIDYLRRENIKATFFAGGKWMRSHEERTQQLMADPLFEIGNHAEAHRNLRLLQGQRLRDEVEGPQRAYETIRARFAQSQCAKAQPAAVQSIAPRLTLFRFPYGACNERALREVHDQGLRAIQWDISTGDPSPQQPAAAIVRAMSHARPGSIILNHANGRGWHTAAALPVAVAKLRQLGFEFVTVSELIAAGEPVIVPGCYDSRPGDTNRYDRVVRRPRPLQTTETPWTPWP
ncbi:MAG: polysaccharide deacetylase family protein [Hyphomicrobium sp.]|nr:polysaccharide deacetylase family protein [Hyphomicrobium sp.]